MVTFRLRFFSNRPKEAAMIPLPREETTPPVTKMNLVMKDPPTKQDSPNDGKTKRALLQKGGSHFLTRYIPNPVSAQFVVYLVERGIVKGGVEALLRQKVSETVLFVLYVGIHHGFLVVGENVTPVKTVIEGVSPVFILIQRFFLFLIQFLVQVLVVIVVFDIAGIGRIGCLLGWILLVLCAHALS